MHGAVALVCRLFELVCDYYEEVGKKHSRTISPLFEPLVRADWKLECVSPDLGSHIPGKVYGVPCFDPLKECSPSP